MALSLHRIFSVCLAKKLLGQNNLEAFTALDVPSNTQSNHPSK